jgi:hypothetical protein
MREQKVTIDELKEMNFEGHPKVIERLETLLSDD